MSTPNNDDLDFEAMMQEKVKEYEMEDNSAKATDERLKEMNKKLPSWNLEPPMKFLR